MYFCGENTNLQEKLEVSIWKIKVELDLTLKFGLKVNEKVAIICPPRNLETFIRNIFRDIAYFSRYLDVSW